MGTDLRTANSDTSLSDARRDFAQVVADSKAMTNPPAAIRSDVGALVSDIGQVNTWLDTKATEAELSGENVPSAVAGPFNDLTAKGKAVVSWTTANCPSS